MGEIGVRERTAEEGSRDRFWALGEHLIKYDTQGAAFI
jgi:hypothetical protein